MGYESSTVHSDIRRFMSKGTRLPVGQRAPAVPEARSDPDQAEAASPDVDCQMPTLVLDCDPTNLAEYKAFVDKCCAAINEVVCHASKLRKDLASNLTKVSTELSRVTADVVITCMSKDVERADLAIKQQSELHKVLIDTIKTNSVCQAVRPATAWSKTTSLREDLTSDWPKLDQAKTQEPVHKIAVIPEVKSQ